MISSEWKVENEETILTQVQKHIVGKMNQSNVMRSAPWCVNCPRIESSFPDNIIVRVPRFYDTTVSQVRRLSPIKPTVSVIKMKVAVEVVVNPQPMYQCVVGVNIVVVVVM
jgi:hypothetical protein